jgi:hypothetical protein
MFRREGEYWTLAYQGRVVRLREAKGLHDIAFLLASPGREIHVADLIAATEPAEADPRRRELSGMSAGELAEQDLRTSAAALSEAALDPRARAEYRARLAELHKDLEEAEAGGDAPRASAIREELDFIAGELVSAFGLGGRSRKPGHPVERARKAVTMRIRDAITRIERVHPPLGRHLEKSIRTGTFCSYSPVPAPAWSF